MDCNKDTWLPLVKCSNPKCFVNPKGKYVPIRNSQKEDVSIIKTKVEKSLAYWNDGDLGFIGEGFQLDYEKIVEDFRSGNLGLPGYSQQNDPTT